MGEWPILFSAPMIRAIFEGRKTQTRRVLSPQPPEWVSYVGYSMFTPPGCFSGRGTYVDDKGVDHGPAEKFIKRPVAPGDRLWVREEWRSSVEFDNYPPRDIPPGSSIFYAADGLTGTGKNRPSIFMPRWVSRITLEVTNVRVERLQEISEADAIAEGIELHLLMGASGWIDYSDPPSAMTRRYYGDPRESYRTLWESINGAGSWAANPWVAAITFRPILANIDAGEPSPEQDDPK